MRLNLSEDVSKERKAAIKAVSVIARAAHSGHEEAGGYSFEGALALGAGDAVAAVSLDYHINVQKARMAAILVIKAATHGNAISLAVKTFQDSLATIKISG